VGPGNVGDLRVPAVSSAFSIAAARSASALALLRPPQTPADLPTVAVVGILTAAVLVKQCW